jgi:hypothetical protein
MKNGLVAAIVGALVTAGIAYAVWGREASSLRSTVAGLENKVATSDAAANAAAADAAKRQQEVKKRATVITLKKDAADPNKRKCAASVEDEHVRGFQTRQVAWLVEDDADDPCAPQGAWRLELEFEEVDRERPFGQHPTRIGQDGRMLRIRKTGKTTMVPYKYKVYMNGQLLEARYPLIDPDLEVEPPPGTLVPPAAPPANPPANPPATPPKRPPAKK